jgi:multimeric flavodoxin WrbA
MRDVYPALRESAAVVIASPVYWFTMAAQTKIFIDRLYAFIGPEGHGMEGKQIGIVLTYQDADPFSSGAVNALRAFQDSFRWMKAPIAGMVYGSANIPGEITKNRAVMKKAFELGVKVASPD